MNYNITMTNKIHFFPAKNEPKGVIVISHGMAEHLGRYDWFINQLNHDGFHVYGRNHRGHDPSINDKSKLGFFSSSNGWEKVVDDLKNVVIHASNNHSNLKIFLFGHSMGSWISLGCMINDIPIDGLIMSGSSKIKKLALKSQSMLIDIERLRLGQYGRSKIMDELSMRAFNKAFSPNRTASDWISDCNDNVDNYESDPFCGYLVTIQLWKDIVFGMDIVFNKHNYKKNIEIPILCISGSDDPVGESSKGVKRLASFLNEISNSKVETYFVDKARHEVLSGTKYEEAYSKIKSFIS